MRKDYLVGSVLLLLTALLTGCGHEEATAGPLPLDDSASKAQGSGMRAMRHALGRLRNWSEHDWRRPPAEAIRLGGSTASSRKEPADLLGVLDAQLRALKAPHTNASRAQHFERSRADALLSVRVLAANLLTQNPVQARRALARVEASCTHCHADCKN